MLDWYLSSFAQSNVSCVLAWACALEHPSNSCTHTLLKSVTRDLEGKVECHGPSACASVRVAYSGRILGTLYFWLPSAQNTDVIECWEKWQHKEVLKNPWDMLQRKLIIFRTGRFFARSRIPAHSESDITWWTFPRQGMRPARAITHHWGLWGVIAHRKCLNSLHSFAFLEEKLKTKTKHYLYIIFFHYHSAR